MFGQLSSVRALESFTTCGSHEKDGHDKVVSVAFQIQTLDERMTRLIRVQCTGVSEVGSVEIVQEVTCGNKVISHSQRVR